MRYVMLSAMVLALMGCVSESGMEYETFSFSVVYEGESYHVTHGSGYATDSTLPDGSESILVSLTVYDDLGNRFDLGFESPAMVGTHQLSVEREAVATVRIVGRPPCQSWIWWQYSEVVGQVNLEHVDQYIAGSFEMSFHNEPNNVYESCNVSFTGGWFILTTEQPPYAEFSEN